MKAIILKLLPLLFVIVWPGILRAQTITTTVGSLTSCPGEIQLPINVTNCNGVGAISLMLNYDTTKLSYIGYQNLNSLLNSGLLIINSTAGKIIISWANSNAASFGTGTLLQLRFNALNATTTNLNWDTQNPGNCEYSDANGNTLSSSFTNGTVTINQLPAVTTQPNNNTIILGQNTSFSVGAIGTGLTYNWQVSINSGSTWTDLTNNTFYSGVNNATLYITNPLLSYNGYKYKCRLTGTCTPNIFSDVVTLNIINPITTTLPTATFCPGNIIVPVTVTNFNGVASFSLTFSYNTSYLTYTGYQSLNSALSGSNFTINSIGGKIYMTSSSTTAVNIGNDTIVKLLFTSSTGTSSLTWDATTPGNCEYSDVNGTLFTPVLINGSETINAIPTVTSNPTNKIIAKGQATSFSIGSSGTGLTHVWQISTNGGTTWADLANNAVYSNVTTTTMSITNAQLSLNNNQYRCKVTGTCSPNVFSNPAILNVLPNIITTCGTATVCPGDLVIPINVTDFIGVASFSLALNFNSSVLTFKGTQTLNAALSGGYFSANAVGNKVYLSWSNTTTATLTGGALLVELKFTGVTGSSILTWDTQTLGNCEYSDTSGLTVYSTWNNGTNVTVYSPPSITSQPVNKSIYATSSTSFSVAAAGTNPAYQWQVSTNNGTSWANLTAVVPYTGINAATLTINPVPITLNGYLYRCIVSGTCTPSVTSGSGLLTVTQAPVTTTPGSITSSCTGNISVPVNVTNCLNVGGISLTMLYDTTKLIYDGYTAVNSAMTSGLLVVNNIGNKIIMSWASATTLNLVSGTLLQYRFKANPSTSTSISWDVATIGACEYSDSVGNIITAIFNNSTISTAASTLIVNTGNDINIAPGGNAQLNATITGGVAPFTYLWSPATGLSSTTIVNPISTPSATTTYTLTVLGNNGCSGSDQITINVVPLPTAAGTINGATTICKGNIVNYSVPAITNATSYIWTIPSGTSIAGADNTNSININFGASATSGNITVKGHNTTGDGASSTLAVFVYAVPDSAGVISGITTVNQGQNGVVYTIPTIPTASSYVWTLPTGFTGTSTTNSITININANAVSGIISVKGQNNCGFGAAASLNITVNTVIITSTKRMQVNAMLQGMYQSGAMNLFLDYDYNIEDFAPKFPDPPLVDTVSILVRDVKFPDYNVLAEFHGIGLKSDGSLPKLTLPFIDTTIKNVYIVFMHRNSIETWSDTVNISDTLINYNFYTHPVSSYFTGNMKDLYTSGGNYIGSLIWSGEIIPDGVINIFDLADVFDLLNDPNAPIGYITEDINGDGVINIYDLALVFDNMNLGVSSINPFTVKKK